MCYKGQGEVYVDRLVRDHSKGHTPMDMARFYAQKLRYIMFELCHSHSSVLRLSFHQQRTRQMPILIRPLFGAQLAHLAQPTSCLTI